MYLAMVEDEIYASAPSPKIGVNENRVFSLFNRLQAQLDFCCCFLSQIEEREYAVMQIDIKPWLIAIQLIINQNHMLSLTPCIFDNLLDQLSSSFPLDRLNTAVIVL